MLLRCASLSAALMMLSGAITSAQFIDVQHLSSGQFLVASERLGDANFSEAVVLLIQYDPDQGAVGIIVNRKTELTLAKIFPDKKASADPVFEGGPVQIQIVQALIRSSSKPAKAVPLIGDVYATGSKAEIDKAVSSRSDPSKFRAYLGYAGWGGRQLEAEIKLGAWSIVRATPKTIFDADPDTLWERLNRQANSQIARAHSERNADAGSTRSARSAGKTLPARVMQIITAPQSRYVVRSPA